ncbi:MAG: acyltransferase family protein [Ruminococcus sp.]|jgi:fucose 4-O-acetylase-like acetyltransferase
MRESEKSRDYFIDNLKAVLIILVIIGHFSLHYSWVPAINWMGDLIYTFHMPCFVFVSGYLAKRVNKDGKLRADKILSFIWLYFVFKLAISLLRWAFGQGFSLSLFHVNQAPWYLFSMAVWYLLVPFIERIKPFWAITGSLIIGILVGYVDIIGQRFSMSRNFVFLPFFIMGFYLSKERLKEFLSKKVLRTAGIIILVCGVILYLFFNEQLQPFLGIIYGAKAYSGISSLPSADMGGLFRLIWYGAAFILSAAVMQVIPRKKTWLSSLGARTLQIYILHVLVRNALVYCGAVDWCKNLPGEVNFLLVWGGSVLLAVVLRNSLFKKIFDVLEGSWLFKKVLN